MRDLVLREGLKTMAGDAALLLRDLLASGVEVPYEVRESGEGSPLAEYVPQTSVFLRDNAAQLATLDSYGTICAAIESDDLATPYLHEMGVPIPADSRRRAELAGVVFLCRLWQGSTDFTLDDVRLTETIEELLDCGEASLGEVEIAVPLRGFQMEIEKLELAGATIVRSDTVDVPAEARGQDGMGGAAWEPSFLVVARVDSIGADDDGSDIGIRAVATFKHVVTSLRLFKAGGVALGPHAWVKAGGDRWRRISTGSGKPRPGGYRLADSELGELSALSRGLAHHSTPFDRMAKGAGGFAAILARALSRFEAGLERPVTLEALNDYLLTLRFMLEGGGPASLGMSMRVAALCAEPDDRTAVKAVIDRAIALERELWSGEPVIGDSRNLPADVAAEVEDMTRAILRDAALGHLGSELRTTADEVLLGDGLRVGEGTSVADRGETAEWGGAIHDPEAFEEDDASLVEDSPFVPAATEGSDPLDSDLQLDDEVVTGSDPALGSDSIPTPSSIFEALASDPPMSEEPFAEAGGPHFVRAQNLIHEHLAPGVDPDFEWAEPAPRSEREPDREPRFKLPERQPGLEAQFSPSRAGSDPSSETISHSETVPGGLTPQSPERRILHAVPDAGPVAALIADSDSHRKEVASRVSLLFPPPETTEWSVAEVGYDRKRRSQAGMDDDSG